MTNMMLKTAEPITPLTPMSSYFEQKIDQISVQHEYILQVLS